jgi:hypothetical protein
MKCMHLWCSRCIFSLCSALLSFSATFFQYPLFLSLLAALCLLLLSPIVPCSYLFLPTLRPALCLPLSIYRCLPLSIYLCLPLSSYLTLYRSLLSQRPRVSLLTTTISLSTPPPPPPSLFPSLFLALFLIAPPRTRRQHGLGVATYRLGGIYRGEWAKGLRAGYGSYIYSATWASETIEEFVGAWAADTIRGWCIIYNIYNII